LFWDFPKVWQGFYKKEDPLEGLPDGIADEVDDELFQLIPLGGEGE
jgi:hypothetical protein